MIQSAHDEDLFEYYATSQLAFIDAETGKVSLAGKPGAEVQGFTPEQRFFLGWGQIWCENNTPEFSRWLALSRSAPRAAAGRCGTRRRRNRDCTWC